MFNLHNSVTCNFLFRFHIFESDWSLMWVWVINIPSSKLFILQFEAENAALRETNKQQEAQILELQKQVQGKSLKFTIDELSMFPSSLFLSSFASESQNLPFVCVFTAFEQRCGGGRGVLCQPGEAQRLSSLTFGCFQVRGKNPQVLTGPAPSQRTLSTQGETEGRDKAGKSPQIHNYGNRNSFVSQDIFGLNETLGKSWTQEDMVS